MQNSDYKIGDFWRDLVNGDLLKILNFNDTALDPTQPEVMTRYVVCACWVNGAAYLGPQEMKLANFERADRFAKVTGWRERWFRIKHFRTRLKKS